MNILFLSTENPYPPDCGHHLRTLNILELLAKQNKIYFLGFSQKESELQYIPNIKPFCETVDIFLIPRKGYNLKFLFVAFKNLFSKNPLVAQRYFLKSAQNKISELIKNYPIDFVHVDMLALGLFRKNYNDIPTILTNHNVESLRLFRWMKQEKNLVIKAYLYYQYRKLRKFEKTICPQFDRCITVSKEDNRYLIELCRKDNFAIIPNGVNIDYFKPQKTKIEADKLVWVGAMDGPYNADAVDYFLEEILPLIQEKVPQVKIDFLGRGATKKLKEASQNPNIKIHGFVEDVRPYINRAAVYIAPIRSGSGTKIKVLNALSLGKAVVTTPVGAEGIDVIDNENIMIANTPREFADKTIHLLQHPKETIIMGNKGRQLIEETYDWKIIERDMTNLYREVAMLESK